MLFMLFVFVPLLFAIYISFHEWTLIGTPEFIGLKNYERLIRDGRFWQSSANTHLHRCDGPLSIGLGLAWRWIESRPLGRSVLRSIYFLPVIVSNVVTAIMEHGYSTTTTASSIRC